MFGKTAVLKVSENYRENVFSSGSVVFLDVYDKHCGYQISSFFLGFMATWIYLLVKYFFFSSPFLPVVIEKKYLQNLVESKLLSHIFKIDRSTETGNM